LLLPLSVESFKRDAPVVIAGDPTSSISGTLPQPIVLRPARRMYPTVWKVAYKFGAGCLGRGCRWQSDQEKHGRDESAAHGGNYNSSALDWVTSGSQDFSLKTGANA